MKHRLVEKYKNEIIPALKKELNIKSIMAIPKLEKIVLNRCISDPNNNKKLIDKSVEEMTTIAGQKAVKTKARKSVATFKIRAGMDIGCKVTLRGKQMYDFFDKLVNVALPRVRDFKGVSPKSFDGRGNYALGIKEQLIFPEIEYDQVEKIMGMDIIICTSAEKDDHARALLKHFGMPFKK
jgi:large subunit ribosomal protein L5